MIEVKTAWTSEELYEAHFPPRQWVIDNMIYPAATTQFFGMGKTGKTHFMLDLALHVAYAEPDFLGFPIHKSGPVVYYMLEERPEDLKPILQSHPIFNPNFYPETMRGQFEIRTELDLSNKDDWQRLKEAATRRILIVIDSLTAIRTRYKKDKPEDAKELMFGFNSIAKETGCAIILINHAKKPTFMQDTLGHKASDEWHSTTYKGASEIADLSTATLQLKTGKGNPRLFIHAGKHAAEKVVNLKRVFRGTEPWWVATS